MFQLNKVTLSIFVGVLFFVVGVFDLPNYGPNWDEPVHFGRGQAMLHYFLTGKKDYQDLSPDQSFRRSYYQHDYYSYSYFEKTFEENKKFAAGTGHPVLSDIFAAMFNRIFYKTLPLFGDIESYHLYSVAVASVLVGVLTYVVSSMYGMFAGFVTALSLALTPLFLGESRFNIKDVPEAVFYSLSILTFYRGIVRNNWKWIIVSSFFSGLAFGTKLNIVFGIFTLGLWLIVVWRTKVKKFDRTVFLSLVSYGIIPLVLYFGSWPILWKDPINRFLYNLYYYKTIGTGGAPIGFTILGINTYAIQWVLFSTPLIILFFALLGIYVGIRTKQNRDFFWLVLFWFLVPIIRVSFPKASIYGGVRQIMEYIPAMAILSGIGANAIYNHYKNNKRYNYYIKVVIILMFLPITFKIISLHPNESIYFNPLIGGLKGASERNIPGWGNSLGSTYRQGVRWLNKNAEAGAKLGFLYELRSNIPEIDLRSDIEFNNHVRSAIQRKGEYVIGVSHDGTQEYSYHRKYLERFLDPVYTVMVDGVPVLKIWKNDFAHSKPEYQKQEQLVSNVLVYQEHGNLVIDLGEKQKVTKLVVQYPVTDLCTLPTSGYFQSSPDRIYWNRETADFVFFPLASWFKTQPELGFLQFLFAAENARFIKLVILDKNSCLLLQPLRALVYTL